MLVIPVESGPLQTVGYLVSNEASCEAVIIDTPLESTGPFLREVEHRKVRVSAIVITHGHWDHIGDAAHIATRLRVPVLIHHGDAMQLRAPTSFGFRLPVPIVGIEPDRLIEEGERISCQGLNLEVLHTPGHSPGHVCLYERAAGILFTGDVLFSGSVGRTDLPGGSYDALMESICGKLLPLPGEVRVYPGHGPATTIGQERRWNPFIAEYLDHFDDPTPWTEKP
jgi:hydroxyacylglutathione hydrolase